MKNSIFLVLALIFLMVHAAKAEVSSCPEMLNRLAFQTISESGFEPGICESCAKNLVATIRSGPSIVTLMANWVSTGTVPLQSFNNIQGYAREKGVEVLKSLSSFLAFPGSGSNANLLTTLVFRGSKTHISEFFRNPEVGRDLANFEILDGFNHQIPMEYTAIYSGEPEEIETVLEDGLKESSAKIILINDSANETFLALVGETVVQNFSRLEDIKGKEITVENLKNFHGIGVRMFRTSDLENILLRFKDLELVILCP